MQQPDSYGWSGGQSAGFPPLQSPMYSSVPVLGRTRCYWTILSASLDFVYLDPILEVHLGDQVGAFMGTNMLNYVHPDEIESLSKDLMPIEGVLSGVEAAGVMGSVTRCRYSRVPRIRKQLGCESPPQGYDSHMFSWMGDFLDLKITTSWIAGSGERKTGAGAVLAFFHGIEDKDSELNNNEADTSAGWSNYCGPRLEDGVYLSKPQCEQLGRVLATLSSSERINYNNPMSSTFSSFYQPPAEYTSTGPPAVVFQILDHLGNILLSFPSPDRASTSASSSNWYNVEEYAKLARAVLARPKEKSESTTSCTRRYRSRHPIFDPRTGSLSTVDSVVILYGAVTFVVFETGGVYLSTQVTRSAYSIEDVPVGAGELVRRESVEAINKYAPSPRHYTPTVESDRGYGGNLSPTIASASAILGSFSNSFTNRQEHSFDLNSSARAANLSRSQSPNFNFRPGAQQLQYSNSASGLQYSNSNSMAPPLSNPIRSSLNQSYSGHPLSHSSNYSPYPLHNPARPPPLQPDQRLPPPQDEIITPIRASSPKTGSRGKALKGKKIAAPTGRKCLHCEKVDSPEWRKGPGGGKTLCNACGLRYSRSLAKMNKNSKAILEAEKASGSNGSDREDQLASPSPTNSPRQLPLPEETTFELPALQGRGPPPIERRQSPLSSNLLYAPHQPVIAHEPVTLRPSPLSMPFSETHLARMSAAESNTPSRNALPFRGNINAYSRPPPRNAQPIAMFSNDRIGMQPDYSASPHSINWPSRNRNELSNSNSFRESNAPIDGSSLQQSQTFQEQQQHYQQQYQQQQQQRRQETLVQQQSNEPLPFAPHHFAPQQSQSSNYSPSKNLPPFDPYSNENGRSGFFQQIDSNNSNSMSANDSNGSSVISYGLDDPNYNYR